LGAEQRQAPSILWRIHRSLGQVNHLLKREGQAQREWSVAREIIAKLAATIHEAASRQHYLQAALASLPVPKEELQCCKQKRSSRTHPRIIKMTEDPASLESMSQEDNFLFLDISCSWRLS
jgi:hypothetical protein